jgi:hypothetical protein
VLCRWVMTVLDRHSTSGEVWPRIVRDAMPWIEEVGYRDVGPSCALMSPTRCTRIGPLLNVARGHVNVPDDDLELY